MQNVFVKKPYTFVPPIQSDFVATWLVRLGLFRKSLKRDHGIINHECRNLDLLRESMKQGHGIMLTPNHPRTSDPVVMGFVARETPCLFYAMASWHLFNQGAMRRLLLRIAGAFSVNREGLDRKAIDEAVNVLVEAKRPLLIFPEGTTSRTNDRLMSLMDGPSFIARTAAKKREAEGKKVVVHPVGLRYLFEGDLERSCHSVLSDIEQKLTWKPNTKMPLIDRVVKVGSALLTLKELQYGINTMEGQTIRQRQTNLVNCLLHPLEEQWLGSKRSDGIAIRIKNLRMKIFPEMSKPETSEDERRQRWQMLEDTYLAQQVDCYPERYITEFRSNDRILETIEKFEEDLTDRCRVHRPMKVIIDVDQAIEVSSKRERGATVDPLMQKIRERLEAKLGDLQKESRMYQA